MPDGINIYDLHRTLGHKPMAKFIKGMCESGMYQVEIFGNPVIIKRIREKITNKFEVPKVTPERVQRGKIHVRIKRPINDYAGDLFVGQLEPELLF